MLRSGDRLRGAGRTLHRRAGVARRCGFRPAGPLERCESAGGLRVGGLDQQRMETDMSGRIPRRASKLAVAVLAVVLLSAVGAGAAGAEVMYNNIRSSSVPVLGSPSDSVDEFGGEVQFAGTDGRSPTVAVEVESYACH